MRKAAVVGLIVIGVAFAVFGGLVLYVFITNRTVDQKLVTNLHVPSDWIDISPESPLTAFRRKQESALAISGYDPKPDERFAPGSFQLPDGKIVSPEIEGIDQSGNQIQFIHTGFTMSQRDLIIYSPKPYLDAETKITKIRIRSDEPFDCAEVFWRNRNPK